MSTPQKKSGIGVIGLIFFLLLALIVSGVAVIFALQNGEVVSVRFLQWGFEQSLALIVMASFGLGMLVAILLSIPGRIRRGFTIRSQRKQLAKHEKVVEETKAEQEPSPSLGGEEAS